VSAFAVHFWSPLEQGSGCRAQGSGLRVQGSGFRAQGSGLRDPTLSQTTRKDGAPGTRQGAGSGYPYDFVNSSKYSWLWGFDCELPGAEAPFSAFNSPD
jgi:hypothetical protein